MKIVIIGNGISGITTARYVRKLSDNEITVISSESEYFFSRTALMYVYMGHLKFEHTQPYENWFWEKNRINLKFDHIESVDFKTKKLLTSNNETIVYDKLVFATGSKPNYFGWKGQNLRGVQGLYTKQDLELMESNTKQVKEAVIVGGGLIGIEMAEMLVSRGIKVNFLIREQHYWGNVLPWEESELITNHILNHHINLIPSSELSEIVPDEAGRVKKVITKDGKEITCQFVGLTAGVSPNIDFMKTSSLQTDKGILVNDFMETNIVDVYAIGDCAQFTQPKEHHPAIEQLWYTGSMQGKTLARTLCGNRTAYDRGIWFNSAKFLDIEFQTYGMMFNKPLDDEDTFFWKHPKKDISIRANFDKNTGALRGFNFMGMRFKQVTADEWIRNKKPISQCISELNKGIFDPEFYKNYHREIVDSFNLAFPNHRTKILKNKFLIF